MNGQFANECEMCGEPLSRKQIQNNFSNVNNSNSIKSSSIKQRYNDDFSNW
jgi:hypothetical protein